MTRLGTFRPQHWRHLLLPPACALCRQSVISADSLCADCWEGLDFSAQACCPRCGFRQEYATGHYCASCLDFDTPWHQFRAPLVYNDTSAQLILSFKYYDRYNMMPMLSKWLYQATIDLPQPDYILPVPLHRWRLWQRRYNQSALLAQRLAHKRGVPEAYQPLALTRQGWFRSQRHLNTTQRINNVTGKFFLNRRYLPAPLQGKHLWLVDDVVTSGATINAITQLLNPLGGQITIVALARVPGILKVHSHYPKK